MPVAGSSLGGFPEFQRKRKQTKEEDIKRKFIQVNSPARGKFPNQAGPEMVSNTHFATLLSTGLAGHLLWEPGRRVFLSINSFASNVFCPLCTDLQEVGIPLLKFEEA